MFWLMPLISGLGTWAATGDFKKGLMSGLLGAGIGGIAGALGGAGGAASGAADAVKAATDAASMSTNLATSGKGLIDAAHLGAKGAELAGLGQAGAQGIQAVGQGVNAAAGPSQNVMQMGADFLARKPVTAGLLLSSLTSAGMAETPETAEKTKGEPFSDQHITTDRNTIGFTGQPPPGPSTYCLAGQPRWPVWIR